MKKILLGAVAIAALTIPASAADIAETTYVDPGPVVVQDDFDWTGFYIGVHGGFGGDDFDYDISADDSIVGPFDIGASLDSSGFFAGGQLGANWQMGQWVLGAEADIAWSEIEGDLEIDIDGLGSGSAGSEINWFGTGRLRLGFLPTSRLMIYGTGGVAYGDVESFIDIDGLFSESTSDVQVGWTAGGGFEYAVTPNITLKTEYLYVDLGSQNLFEGDIGGFADNLTVDADTQFHTIKAGLNFLW
jgi:outer membrane immunogenic protein